MIIRVDPENVKKEYPALYRASFGEAFDGSYPPYVLLATQENGERIGWFSGYAMNKQTFYLQRAGKMPGYMGDKTGVVFTEQFLRFLKKKLRFKYVNAYIENTNLPALMTVMKSGFLVNGVRVSDHPKATLLSVSRKL